MKFALICAFLTVISVVCYQHRQCLVKTSTTTRLTKLHDARKDAEREEQWRIQQEILSRRKSKPEMDKYKKDVEERRQATWAKAMEINYARYTKNSEDPLAKFKANQASGKVAPIGYEPAPPSRSGFSLPIPVNPIGIAKYDEGLRFDLRLPYAERGYEDPDADVMAKAGSFLSGMFGGKKAPPKVVEEPKVEAPPPPPKKKNWPF